jgi:hypothetical protein
MRHIYAQYPPTKAARTDEAMAWSRRPRPSLAARRVRRRAPGNPVALSFTIPGSTPLTEGKGVSGPSISVSSGTTVDLGVTISSTAASALNPNGNPGAIGWLLSLYAPAGSTKPTAAYYWPIVVTTPTIAGDAGLDASATTSMAGRARESNFV